MTALDADLDLATLLAMEVPCEGRWYLQPRQPCPGGCGACWRAWAHCCSCPERGPVKLVCDACLQLWIEVTQQVVDGISASGQSARCMRCGAKFSTDADHFIRRTPL